MTVQYPFKAFLQDFYREFNGATWRIFNTGEPAPAHEALF